MVSSKFLSYDSANMIGAITAQLIYLSSIITFLGRIYFKTVPGHWLGIPLLFMALPLVSLLFTAPGLNRPFIYYLQIVLMLAWIILLFLVDYVFHYDFRHTQWMVVGFVMFYFAAMGGMIGVAALAGNGWMISSIILFFITAILAFVQRAVTGY